MNNLCIILWNANGLLSRKQELEQFLFDKNVDVALVTETNCTSIYALNRICNYSIYNAFHPSGKAQGGATIFIKKSLVHSPYHTTETEKRTPAVNCERESRFSCFSIPVLIRKTLF